MPLWRRLATTVALALLPVVGERIRLPSLDGDSAFLRQAPSTATTSVFALGVTPFLSAYLAVEVAALLVPRWRKLRHENPEGRRLLRRAVLFLALVLAAFQAFGVAMLLSSVQQQGADIEVSRPLVVVSLVAATSLLALVAGAIDKLGLVNGVLALTLASAGNGLPSLFAKIEPPTEPSGLAIEGALYLLPFVATWAALRGSATSAQRTSPCLSTPLSSIQPVSSAPALLALPASLSAFELPFVADVAEWLAGGYYRLLVLGVGVVLTLLLSWLLHGPRAVSGTLERLGHGAATPRELKQAFVKQLWPTLLLVVTLLAVDQLTMANGLPPLALPSAFLTALLLDGFGAFRVHRASPGLVCVWEELRPYAVPELVSSAERAGIKLLSTGLAQTSLLRFFGPYATIRLWAAPADAAQARALFAELLSPPSPTTEVSAPRDRPAASPQPAPWGTGVYGWLQIAAGLAVAALALASYTPGSGLFALTTRVTRVQAQLEVVTVDDELDPLTPVPEAALPAGVAKLTELIRGAEGEPRYRPYARLVLQGEESIQQALERLTPWLASLNLPANASFAWEAEAADPEAVRPRFDQANNLVPSIESYRSYLVQGAPIFTAQDVQSVSLSMSSDGFVSTALRLTPSAAERMRLATHDPQGLRLAIIVNHLVVSAPVVRAEIANGMLQISPGGLNATETQQRAEALLRKLTITTAR